MIHIDIKGIIKTTQFIASVNILSLRYKLFKYRIDLSKIKELCKKHLDHYPNSYIAYYHLAKSSQQLGELEQAVNAYRKIIAHPSSRFFSDTSDFLWMLLESEHYEEAIAIGETAIKNLDARLSLIEKSIEVVYLDTIHRVLGGSYSALGQYKKAIPHLEAGYKINICKHPEELLERINYCREQIRTRGEVL